MARKLKEVVLLSPDGEDELAVIPAELMEEYMKSRKIKSRSDAAVEKAAQELLYEIAAEAKKNLAAKKSAKKKVGKKNAKSRSKRA